MEIKLHKIGIIEDSDILLNGLTVVTGENETGKTTVGKALYAIADTVSDLPQKAKADKDAYILKELMKITGNTSFSRALFSLSYGLSSEHLDISDQFPALTTLAARSFVNYRNDIPDPETFAYKTEEELREFLLLLDADKETRGSAEWLSRFLFYYSRETRKTSRLRKDKSETPDESVMRRLHTQIEDFLKRIRSVFETIKEDQLLEHYVKDSLNSTLRHDFSRQIQPVRDPDAPSSIALSEGDFSYLKLEFRKNSVTKAEFHEFPLRKAYLVDNPIVLDHHYNQLMSVYRQFVLKDTKLDSYFNPQRIRNHTARLSAILRGGEELSPIEQRVLNEKLNPVREKIDEIVPGTFDFSRPDDEFYISPEGMELSLGNLAAGSKMFSVIKILLERGLLEENSVLILDEPEVHLHPKWLNRFAEVVALLVKELRIRVLLTTHSFHFLLALDAYARKYEIMDLSNFYQARRLDNGAVTHKRVTKDLAANYDEFVEPLEKMDALRDTFDKDGDDEA